MAQKKAIRRGGALAAISAIAASSWLAVVAASGASAQELITNGDFETGDATGWTLVDTNTSQHTFLVLSGIGLPLSELLSVGPSGGSWYAVADSTGNGTSALLQSFTVPADAASVALSFDMFVRDFGGNPIVDPIGLDHTGPPNQHARVDVLTASAGAFDTGATVLANYYLGADAGTNPVGIPYVNYALDLTGVVVAGSTYQLRFALTDNQIWLNQGVDNVSIVSTPAPPVPLSPVVGLGVLVGATLIAGRVRPRRPGR